MTRRWLLSLVLAAGCNTKPIPADQAYPAGTAFQARQIVVDGTRLRIIDSGRGPAVVFIHGLEESMYAWRYQLPYVVRGGYRVIAYDNRGFGFSDRPTSGYSNAAYARLGTALLDSLGVGDAVLVGHGMGAAIAVEIALAHPDRVRGLVLIAPSGYGPFALRRGRSPFGSKLGWLLHRRRATAAMFRSDFANPGRVTDADIDQYYAPLAVPGASAVRKHVMKEFRFDALRGRVRDMNAPTLVLRGIADRWIQFSAATGLAQDVPHGAFIIIQNAGHNAQEERPQEVNELLTAFLLNGLPQVRPDVAAGRSTPAARSTPSRTRGD